MGDKELHEGAVETEKSSYKVIKYNVEHLPDSYRNMILAKYLRSLRHTNDYFKKVDAAFFFKYQTEIIQDIMLRANAYIKLAVLSDDNDVVLGWSLMEPTILHYVWVGADYRNLKIGSILTSDAFHTITHYTKSGFSIWQKKFPNVVFNPYS